MPRLKDSAALGTLASFCLAVAAYGIYIAWYRPGSPALRLDETPAAFGQVNVIAICAALAWSVFVARSAAGAIGSVSILALLPAFFITAFTANLSMCTQDDQSRACSDRLPSLDVAVIVVWACLAAATYAALYGRRQSKGTAPASVDS